MPDASALGTSTLDTSTPRHLDTSTRSQFYAHAMPANLARVAARHAPIRVQIAGGGRFGDRVVWARLDADLRPPVAGVRRAADRAGYDVEDRPFRAHLTLARARRGADLRPLADALAEISGPTWDADVIVLMRGGQPDYEQLEAWPLRG